MSYPILYPSTETEFASNGIGILSDAVECIVTEERNGGYELQMQYPVTGVHYGHIARRCLVMAKPNPVSDPQPFRIYRITRPMGGVVTVYAAHISYDLSGIPVSPFAASSAAGAMSALASSAAVDCPFEFWTDKTTTAAMTVSTPASIRSLLGGSEGSVLDVYGGEYEFDRYTVRLYGQRGADRGVSIRYGKNLTDLTQEENCESVYTGCYPYWADADGNLVTLPEKILDAEGTYDFTRILPLDLSDGWQQAPTEDQLREKAVAYMKNNHIGTPKISLTVSFAQLEQTEEYKGTALLERVLLCDTVNVEFPALGVSATAKCVKTVYDCLLERYDKVELGDARTTIADTLADQNTSISKKPDKTYLRAAIDSATAQITGNKGGYVVLHSSTGGSEPDEILIMDSPEIENAINVWRWNKAGLGHSSTGYNGPYGLAMTQDGSIVADYINVGTLTANLIRSGVLQSLDGKTFFLDLESGILRMNATDLKISGQTTEQIADDRIDGKLTGYSTTQETKSLISQSADQITNSVSKVYATQASVESVKTTANNAASKADSAAAKADGALSDAKSYTDRQLETVRGELSAEIEQTPSRIQLSVLRTGYFPVFEYINWTNYTAGTFGNKITLSSSGTKTARLITTDPDTLSYARGNTLQGYLSYQIHTAIVGKASASYLRLSFVVIYADGTNTAQHILYEDGQKTMASVCSKTNAALNLAVADKEIRQIYLEVLTNKCSGVIEVGEVWANVAELNGKASTLTLTADGAKISSANIVMRGAVSYEDLSGTGSTTINGSNIATGCLANHDRSALFDLDGKRFRMGTSSGERVFIDKSGIQWYGGTGTTGATAQGVIKNGLTTTSSGDTTVYGADTRYQKYGWYHDGNFQGITVEQVDNEVMVSGKLSVNQAVSCRTLKAWDAKERVVRTPLGNLQMNAMESPEPLFWDVGSGVCDSTGVCWIALRPEYAETISRRTALRWVVTPTGGPGSLWVEKLDTGAMVHGGAGQRFDWACAGVQRGFEGCYAEGDPGRYPVPENPGDWLLTAAMDEAAVDLPLTI